MATGVAADHQGAGPPLARDLREQAPGGSGLRRLHQATFLCVRDGYVTESGGDEFGGVVALHVVGKERQGAQVAAERREHAVGVELAALRLATDLKRLSGRPDVSTRQAKTARSSPRKVSFMERMEERWRRRWEDRGGR